ncbi:MAG: TOPRIM nucleotidyl transferase/hydrolase domain-containing protein [Microcystis sp.]
MLQKKLAIFVEGQTERILITRLLQEIAGYKKVSVEVYQVRGDKANRKIQRLKSNSIEVAPFFVLLYDCGCDSHVLSDIKKQYVSLTDKGYEKILGLRDLYPEPLENRTKVENGIKGFLKPLLQNKGIPISMILVIMEIEAWFLGEYSFLTKIDSCLTSKFILDNLGFELNALDVEQIPHPSQVLDRIYQLIQRSYDKSETTVEEIASLLDYEFIYLHLVEKIKQLKQLIDAINLFFQ